MHGKGVGKDVDFKNAENEQLHRHAANADPQSGSEFIVVHYTLIGAKNIEVYSTNGGGNLDPYRIQMHSISFLRASPITSSRWRYVLNSSTSNGTVGAHLRDA